MSSMARRSPSRRAVSPSRASVTAGARAAPIAIVPGGKEYVRGDEIPRPQGGGGGGGSEGSPDGSGEDSFEFTLTREEFLDMFFEDLELPDLVKKTLKDTTAVELHRAGYTVTGSPSNLSIPRTMRQAISAAHLPLHRPEVGELEALREEIEKAKARGADDEVDRLTPLLEKGVRWQDHPVYRPARRAVPPLRARCRSRTPKPSCSA